jgi:inner membrane protein
MDSLSHVIIGAAIGETLVGKKIGRWGMVLGAIAKSMPDFDLFYTGLDDTRAYMCQHRAHTHSLFIEALYAVPIAYLLARLFKEKVSFSQMLVLMLACLWGHSLLDWCTNFGTQLLLPFSNGSYSLNTLAIVDIVFTLPMLVLMLIAVFNKHNTIRRLFLAKMTLLYCFLYLGLTFFNKHQAESLVQSSLLQNQIPATAHLTNPTILNNILWYAVASNDSTVFAGEYSLWYPNRPIRWYAFARNQALMDSSKSKKDIEILRWFSDPYTMAQANGDTLNVYAAKFGRINLAESDLEKSFVLHYMLFQKEGVWQMGIKEPTPENTNYNANFVDMWERICGRK